MINQFRAPIPLHKGQLRAWVLLLRPPARTRSPLSLPPGPCHCSDLGMHFKADSLLRCAAVVAGVVASFAASALHFVRPEGPAPLVALPSVPRQFGGGHPLAWAVLSLPISQSVVLYLAVVFIFRVYTYETPFFVSPPPPSSAPPCTVHRTP